MRYVESRFRQRRLDEAYRFYVSDSLRIIGQSIADVSRASGGEGRYIGTRFADIIRPQPVETRTAEEIIADLRRKLEVG